MHWGSGALPMRKQTFPMDRQLAAKVASLGRSVVVAKGTPLFDQGAEPRAVYVLKSGSARVTLSDSRGAPKLRVTATAGSILGLPAVFASLPYSMGAELADTSRVVVISRGLLLDAARQDGAFCLRLLKLLGEEVHAVRRLVPSLSKRRPVRR
jgi:CRP/FNR family transcriptional regulator, cyclic AMP receptor protein